MDGRAVEFDDLNGGRVRAAYAPLRRLFETPRDFVVSQISVTAPRTVWAITPDCDVHPLSKEEANFANIEFFRTLCRALAEFNGVDYSDDDPILRCDAPDGRRFRCVIGAEVPSSIAVSVSEPSRLEAFDDDDPD